MSPSLLCWCGAKATPLVCMDNPHHNPLLMVDPSPHKLYLLGPDDGPTSDDMFVRASEYLRFVDYEVVWTSSLVKGFRNKSTQSRQIMRDLLECHGVALVDGWWTSPEVLTLVLYAGSIDLPLRSVPEWVSLAVPCNAEDFSQ